MSNAKKTTDHLEIRRWAESRGAKPALVKDSPGPYEIGVLRMHVPGSDLGPRAETLSWDAFFQKFDEEALAMVIPEEAHEASDATAKLVRREGYHRGL